MKSADGNRAVKIRALLIDEEDFDLIIAGVLQLLMVDNILSFSEFHHGFI